MKRKFNELFILQTETVKKMEEIVSILPQTKQDFIKRFIKKPVRYYLNQIQISEIKLILEFDKNLRTTQMDQIYMPSKFGNFTNEMCDKLEPYFENLNEKKFIILEEIFAVNLFFYINENKLQPIFE